MAAPLGAETVARLSQLAESTGKSIDTVVAEALDALAAKQADAVAQHRQPLKRPRRSSAGKKLSAGASGSKTPGKKSKHLGLEVGLAAESQRRSGDADEEEYPSGWKSLPYSVAMLINDILVNDFTTEARARLRLVCRGWGQVLAHQFVSIPEAHSIHNRKASWELLADRTAPRAMSKFGSLRSLSLGIQKMPAKQIIPLLQLAPGVKHLDLHFPPTFHLNPSRHLGDLKQLPVSSLGLHLRCFRVPHSSIIDLGRLTSLHRLSYKVHRLDNVQTQLENHVNALQTLTQLQELSLRLCVEMEGMDYVSVLPALAPLTALRSLKIRTIQQVVDTVMLPKLEGVSLLTSLQSLDVDGSTDIDRADMDELSNLKKLESLNLRNSCYVSAQQVTSLQDLVALTSLDFSLHADYVDIAGDAGENQMPAQVAQAGVQALASLTNLRHLDIGNRYSFQFHIPEHLQELSVLTQLTKLCMKNLITNRFSDLSTLRSLRLLKALSLEGCESDIAKLFEDAPLTKLTHLCLRSCAKLCDNDLHHIAKTLKGLSILDVAECNLLSDHGVSLALKELPTVWALALPGQALTLEVLSLLQGLEWLAHLLITRVSRARLEGVNFNIGEEGDRHRISGELVRRYLRAELPGKIREHDMFYRAGYLDYPDWNLWWLSETEHDELLSDRDPSDSETDDSGDYSDPDDWDDMPEEDFMPPYLDETDSEDEGFTDDDSMHSSGEDDEDDDDIDGFGAVYIH